MPSVFLVSVCLVLGLSTITTQTFTSLEDFGDYQSLEQCQKACLDDAFSSTRYDNFTNAINKCESLPDQLNDVNGCVERQVSPCNGNSTAVRGAQSILASYCTTAISLVYNVSIPATTISGTAGSANTEVVTSTGVSATSTVATGGVAGASAAAATGSGGPGATVSTATTSPSGTPSTGPVPTSASSKDARKPGLTSSGKAAIGVGVGLGIPLIMGTIVAWWILSRCKKSRAAGGPYGPFMASEKGRTESASYSSSHVDPQEMHPMGSAVPFLPTVATRDIARHEEQYEPTPATATSKELPYSDVPATGTRFESAHSSPQQEHFHSPQERPATSRDVSRDGTPPPLDTQIRPATAHARLAPPDDEPPSPVSPVSPISSAGSRPASLRQSVEHHDL